MKPILVIRFSSLGDVALTVPVFKSMEKLLPGQSFIIVTNSAFKELFDTCKNVEFFDADLTGVNNGFVGLFKLYNRLQKIDFDHIIDLHNVFRTNFLTALFKLKGKKVIEYNKLRASKNAIINSRAPLKPLLHTVDQYLLAFHHLHRDPQLQSGPWIEPLSSKSSWAVKSVCLAPFSTHPAKEWPHTHMVELIGLLEKEKDLNIHCMAFNYREQSIVAEWKADHPDLRLIDHMYSLKEQLELLAKMDVVVSMDSANMHLASLVGAKVISLWGPTHPYLGFSPLDNESGILQPEEDSGLKRPLSRYGNLRSNQDIADSGAGMATISPKLVFDKILKILNN